MAQLYISDKVYIIRLIMQGEEDTQAQSVELKENKDKQYCTKANMPEGKINHTQDHDASMVDSGLTSRLLTPGLACLSTKRKHISCA